MDTPVKYFAYPGDGYNNWTVLVWTGGKFLGTSRVYANGSLRDPITTAFTEKDAWGWREITLAEASNMRS